MSNALALRILDAFPTSSYSLAGLLRLVDIVETDRVPTACVECKAQPRMLLNPAFIAAHAQTPQKLLMLVMHEVHHVLLGHTRMLGRMTATRNFILDALINGIVCRMFPGPQYTAMFRDFYGEDAFPACLLAPPPQWPGPAVRRARGLCALPEALAERAHQVHVALYSEAGASYEEVMELLPRLLAACPEAAGPDGIPLLGDHREEETGRQPISGLLAGLLRESVQGWTKVPDPIRGHSLEQLLEQETVGGIRSRTPRALLRNLLLRIAGEGRRAAGRGPGWDMSECSAPMPRLHRRTLVQRALGLEPLLHPTPLRLRGRTGERDRVHVYLDVSGSMDSVVGAAYGALLDCRAWVHPRVHLFSDKVSDVSIAGLRAGLRRTTWGTRIGCVAAHMREHEVRRAVLLTDGCVGPAAHEDARVLEKVRLGVALIGDSKADDLRPFADRIVTLPLRSAA